MSQQDASFIGKLLNTESATDSLVSRGYCVIKVPTEISFIYSSFYAVSHSFFNASERLKQSYSQIQFNENTKSPNSLHGYSLVANNKEQFMIRYMNSSKAPSLKQLKTPNHEFMDHHTAYPDFGILSFLLFEKLDILCRNIMKDVLVLYNKPEAIVADILDPIHVINGNIVRDNKNKHCFGEYTLNAYISSSVLDCYHYFAHKDNKYGHDSHRDSGLLTLIHVTNDNPSLEVLDQKENQWINIEELIHAYCDAYDDGNNKDEYAVVLFGESVNPYFNQHISNVNNYVKPCFYRINNGGKDRYSVVFKQRTAPLRSHARYQEDYVLAKLHAEIDTDSVHSRLMIKGTDKEKDYRHYNKYYEYDTYDKAKWSFVVASAVFFGFFIMKRKGFIDVKITFNWK